MNKDFGEISKFIDNFKKNLKKNVIFGMKTENLEIPRSVIKTINFFHECLDIKAEL